MKFSVFSTVVLAIRAPKLPCKWLSNITMFAPCACATKQIVISIIIRIAGRLASWVKRWKTLKNDAVMVISYWLRLKQSWKFWHLHKWKIIKNCIFTAFEIFIAEKILVFERYLYKTHGACTVSVPESSIQFLMLKVQEVEWNFSSHSGCLAVSSGQGGKICSRRQRSFRKMSSLGRKPGTSRDKGTLFSCHQVAERLLKSMFEVQLGFFYGYHFYSRLYHTDIHP